MGRESAQIQAPDKTEKYTKMVSGDEEGVQIFQGQLECALLAD